MGSKSKKTTSRHITEAETGTHAFEIVGYSLKKGIGVGKFIMSGTFTVGGTDWSIRFYPDGYSASTTKQYAAIYLELRSMDANVCASYCLSLVNHKTGLLESLRSETTARVFNSSSLFSLSALVERSKLDSKSPGYIVNDSLTFECSVTVIKDSQVLDIGVLRLKCRRQTYQSILASCYWRRRGPMSHSVWVGRIFLHTRLCSPHGPLSSRRSFMDR